MYTDRAVTLHAPSVGRLCLLPRCKQLQLQLSATLLQLQRARLRVCACVHAHT
jgi:hypothetical protein